ncbi:MAG TPA: hypothetical protein VF749_11590 [Candidatus Acidoferrum sp.]
MPAKAWHFTRLGVTPSDPSELAAIEFAIPPGVKCEHPYEPISTLTHGLTLSPDEKELWVTSLLDEALYVYEVKSQKIVARVPTDRQRAELGGLLSRWQVRLRQQRWQR